MTKRTILENKLWALPISPINKFRMVRTINIIYNIFSGREYENVAIVDSNEYYGHEYWLKKYSSFNDPIYGLIEHGVYFGKNKNKVGNEREYLLKNIITFGDYREEMIKEAFPEHNVIKIGPRIAYANTDLELLNGLNKESDGEKVLTLFPAHSSVDHKCRYDVDHLISKAKEIMDERKIKILRVCLKEQDMVNGNADLFKERGCKIVTAGSASIQFLPRLRAIILSSYITMSNSLGTHLGYCIYLNKPHYLIHQDMCMDGIQNASFNNEVYNTYKNEEKIFIEAFDRDNGECITEEQYKLCDFYWGFGYVRKPSELHKLLIDVNLNKR